MKTGESTNILFDILAEILLGDKIHPKRDAAFDEDYQPALRILKFVIISHKC